MTITYEDYKVRSATLRDSARIQRLEKAIFPKDAYPLFEIWMLFLLPRIYNYVAVAPDADLAAFLSFSHPIGTSPAWIITVGVAEAHQRKGLGRFMMQLPEQKMTRPRIRLTVRASNTPAIALYEQIGYREIDRRRRYYNDGEDGLIMEKQCSDTPHM